MVATNRHEQALILSLHLIYSWHFYHYGYIGIKYLGTSWYPQEIQEEGTYSY